MIKNKILFVIDSLRIGGVQSALINLLQALDYNVFDVSLLLFHFEEKYLSLIPKDVQVLKMPFVIDAMNMTKESAKNTSLSAYFAKAFGAISCRYLGSKLTYKLLFNVCPRIKEKFDVAISFTNNLDSRSTYFGCNQYVLNYINAKHKASWLHVDYEAMNMNTTINNNEYLRFDRIIHVSEGCKEIFLKYIPVLANKSVVAYNIIDPAIVHKKSTEYVFDYGAKNIFKIITIARLDKNKNITACVNIAKRLKENNIAFIWNILGDGQDKNVIEELIKKEDVSDCVRLIGYVRNPYPILKESDILVSTSLSESFGMAIYESTVLGIPVVAYNYPALKEIINHGVNGYICNAADDIHTCLQSLASDKNLYNRIKNNCIPLINYSLMLDSNVKAITFKD